MPNPNYHAYLGLLNIDIGGGDKELNVKKVCNTNTFKYNFEKLLNIKFVATTLPPAHDNI